MLIQFTRDFRSAATREEWYPAGTIIDLANGSLIVAEGAAIPYIEPDPLDLSAVEQPEPDPVTPEIAKKAKK